MTAIFIAILLMPVALTASDAEGECLGNARATSLLQAMRNKEQATKATLEDNVRSVLNVMERLEATVAKLEQRDSTLQQELAQVQKQDANLREEDAGLRREVARMQQEDSGLKEELLRAESLWDGAGLVKGPLPGLEHDLKPSFDAAQFSSQDLNPACKRMPVPPAAPSHTTHVTSEAQALARRHSANSTASCSSSQLKLMDFQPSGVVQTCCPKGSTKCAGCASYAGSSCTSCMGGFIKRSSVCTACTDSAGWLSEDGVSCSQLQASECSDVKVRGQSSNEACCQCGGGVVTPTPFSYPSLRWSLDADIELRPEPRTADRYTVDAQCELAAHNLTMDSTTGRIFYLQGRQRPTEAFVLECEVTAHQAAGISMIATVTVAADVLTYGSSTLLFHTDSSEAPKTTGSGWSNFELGCAPEVSWLAISSQNGHLHFTGQTADSGGVSVAEERFYGQDGAVCAVSAWKANKRYQTTFVAIRPRPWSTLEYHLSGVSTSIGEELHPLVPQKPAEQGLMKPWTYTMACDVSGAGSAATFSFDRILSMGFLAGHSVLEIGAEGEITVAPSSSLSALFDTLDTSGSSRKAITLDCRVFGVFPDPSLPPVHTALSIEVQDTMCWVPQTVKAVAVPDITATSEAQCRSRCRADATCANYHFNGQCRRYDVRSDGQSVTVNAKVTNCTNDGTCMSVTHSHWFLSGIYCPLGRSVATGHIVYLREHITSQDRKYLRRKQPGDGCDAGEWALLATSPGDYVNKALGIYELRGTVLACIASSAMDRALMQCSTKALSFMEEQEADEGGLPSLVLDDPGTLEPADFWLHPCDCAPTAWGPELPVDPQMFEHLPANSSNKFIPVPFVIVSGQLTCPSRQLLGGDLGVHYQTEEEVLEPGDCEARCREQAKCTFFWHGSQHGASTCRLFHGCDNLVREFGLEGDLKAMPRGLSCAVADAAQCWATSLRRNFLSMAFDPDGGAADTSAPGLVLPPKPADPPTQGMVAWFKSENAGEVWSSSVGNFEGRNTGYHAERKVGAEFGADRPVTYVQGTTSGGYKFGKVLAPTFTICSVTSYAGTTRKRILQTESVNWLHGHYNGYSGVAFYQKWVTAQNTNPNANEWVVLCGTNGAQRVYSGMSGSIVNVATAQGSAFSEYTGLSINHDENDKSDFAVMEVITWDRVLTDEEMKASVQYLMWKLRVGAVLEVSEHLATQYQSSFYKQGSRRVDGETVHADLANGYRAEMSGWNAVRNYALGFVRWQAGVAVAVVKGLTPGAQYVYQLYMTHRDTSMDTYGNAVSVRVQQGQDGRAQLREDSNPRFAGVAVATPAGEIRFDFEPIHVAVHLSGISIAAVGPRSDPPQPSDPPRSGMVAWFKSENAGGVWSSSVGNFEARNTEVLYRRVQAGNGADRPVTYIEGPASSGIRFGAILAPTFTICSVTRYTGNKRKRILQTASPLNWLHGHHDGHSGVAFYKKWVTPSTTNPNSFDWVVLCGTNGAQRVYSGMSDRVVNVATDQGSTLSEYTHLYINSYGQYTSEFSDFAIMELITWDRALTDEEMRASTEYLKWKLRVGAVLEVTEHLSTQYQSNFADLGAEEKSVNGETVKADLANGYTAEMSGWSALRNYARGFVSWSNPATAVAVVKGLIPGAQHIYSLFMVSTDKSVSFHDDAVKVSVNGGLSGRARLWATTRPIFQGVATANPRGEINFEFQPIHAGIYLSGISIAKVGSPSVLLEETSTKSAAGAMTDGFVHLHLYRQCDAVLLLGGMGVQQCGRPGHRTLHSHSWQHKRLLPQVFDHGALLLASCWSERYQLLRQDSKSSAPEQLRCVNGNWYNSLGKPDLRGLACEACVQVGAAGYAAYDERNEQELYFFNRMGLSVYTELGMIQELSSTSAHKHCLGPSADGNMVVSASTGCPAKMLAQVTGYAGPEGRLFKLIPDDMSFSEEADQCLSTKGNVSGLKHVTCNQKDEQQHLAPAELPKDMWYLHIEADERDQDLHTPYSSFCGTSGALSTFDFGQLFVGDSAKSSCKFAPLIRWGDFQDTGIQRDKSSSNWPSWHHLLADHPVECAAGEALTAFKLEHSVFRYECSKIGGLGSCFDYYSAQVEIGSFGQERQHWSQPLRMMPVDCGQNAVLGGFHFEFSEGGKWGRVRYQCCKAGGAPITFDPRGAVPELISRYDGVYCPTGRGPTGRLEYATALSRSLTFDEMTGKWCVDAECSAITDSISPIGITGAAFDVVNVSDFNGDFLAALPKEGSKALSLAEALKLKPPKRPRPPPMPELQEFKAQQPTYAAECLNYENLWKGITETFKDEEDNDVQKTSSLEADPATEDAALDSYHPCEVAKSAGGIFGQWGGGDGSTAPENMMYADWNDCMQGDIERDLASAKLDYHAALTDFIADVTNAGMGMMCALIPDVTIAPMGAGLALNPGDICGGIADLLSAAYDFAGPISGFHFAKQGWSIEQEGYAACNPMQIGFARAFCDIHCVRDAVVRGDRSIIRNLELATKKTNSNMKALVKWSTDAARTETGWLGEKLDYMHTLNMASLQDIRQQLGLTQTGQANDLLQSTQAATDTLFAELAGYAQTTSFDEVARITARDALEDFLKAPDLPSSPNSTEAAALLGHLEVLHQTLRRAGRGGAGDSRDKSQMVGHQMARTLRQLQRQASFQLRTLGVYRLESNASRHAAQRSWDLVQEHEVLMSLDHIWWQIRNKLDGYLEVAEDEVKAFQGSLLEMQNYMECKKGFGSLAASYTQSMTSLRRSHRRLRATWRQGSNLIGELAAVLADSEAFATWAQSCRTDLLEQTLQQLRSAIFGMAFLLHRFRAAKLPDPDTQALKQATHRIQKAYTAATSHCA